MAIQPYGLDTGDYVILNELDRRGSETRAAISRNSGVTDFPSAETMQRLVQAGRDEAALAELDTLVAVAPDDRDALALRETIAVRTGSR